MTFPLLTEPEAAEKLSIHVSTLRRLRRGGEGPTFVRVGQQIRYRQEDIDLWIAERSNR